MQGSFSIVMNYVEVPIIIYSSFKQVCDIHLYLQTLS